MICYAMLYYTILYYAILYYTTLYHMLSLIARASEGGAGGSCRGPAGPAAAGRREQVFGDFEDAVLSPICEPF